MKAAVLETKGELIVRELPDPDRAGWAVVETRAAGIRGTELHILDAMFEPPGYPFVIGHEVAGHRPACPGGLRGSTGPARRHPQHGRLRPLQVVPQWQRPGLHRCRPASSASP